jgi:hypothetical protein
VIENKQLILPDISPAERTPFVETLFSIIQAQFQEIQVQSQEIQVQFQEIQVQFQEIQELKQTVQLLKDEIAKLTGQKTRPSFLPRNLESNKTQKKVRKKQKTGKRSITKNLEIHATRVVEPTDIPTGSVRNGYQDFVIRDIVIKPHNTRVRLARWISPDGKYIVAELPKEYNNKHFGPGLQQLILALNNGSVCATQPALKEFLDSIGIDISTGQISQILTNSSKLEVFHKEKDEIFKAGIETSTYLTTDDTGWRHKGENYFSNYIGSSLFGWFETSRTKSRVQFLTNLLRGEPRYTIDENALQYMKEHKITQILLSGMGLDSGKEFENKQSWDEFLKQEFLKLNDEEYRLITEGAIVARLVKEGFPENMVILSDGAKQFDVFLHALCWVHAERPFRKLIPINDAMREAIDSIRDQTWTFYESLKAYQQQPTDEAKETLSQEFDQIFTQKTEYLALNEIIASICRNKSGLLVVLDRPEIPLHNNASEQAMHGPVKKRKISRGSKSNSGLKCRDTFASLKETCRKLDVSFWHYLLDRLTAAGKVPSLAALIHQKTAGSSLANTS